MKNCDNCGGWEHSPTTKCNPPGKIDTYKGPRPICLNCNAVLRPNYHTVTRFESGRNKVVSRCFQGDFGHFDKFCSKQCGFFWAVGHSTRRFQSNGE